MGMHGNFTSFPVSNGLAFQQSCRPKASTALCNVRKISPLQCHTAGLFLGKGGTGSICMQNHGCCADDHQAKRMQAVSPLLQDI